MALPSRWMWQGTYLGVVYATMFLGYYATQAYVSSLYPAISGIGWALLYAAYGASSIVAPTLAHLPMRRGFTLVTVLYLCYLACVSSRIDAVYLAGSVLVGFAAGVGWFLQGRYFTRLAAWEGHSGALNAVFWAIFYAQNVLGSGVSLAVLYSGLQVASLIWVMMGVSFVAVLLSLFIRPVKRVVAKPHAYVSLRTRVTLMWRAAREKPMLLLLPLIAAQASGLVLSYQVIPRRIFALAPAADAAVYNAFVFLAYGFGTISGAYSGGALMDTRPSWRAVLWPVCAVEVASSLLLVLLSELHVQPVLWWIPVGLVRGFSDAALNSLLSVAFTRVRFETPTAEMPDGFAFGLYRGIYCACYVPFSLLVGFVPYFVLVACSLTTSLCATLLYTLVRLRAPVDEDTESTSATTRTSHVGDEHVVVVVSQPPPSSEAPVVLVDV